MRYFRNIHESIRDSLLDSPVLLVSGARQVGKSTLVKSLLADTGSYTTLDDLTSLASARSSPALFLEGLNEPAVIDEVQRAPELFLPLKAEVDKSRSSGRYVLTGSTNALLLPNLADSLAGRMEVHTIWPLSQGELRSYTERFIDVVFSKEKLPRVFSLPASDLIGAFTRGGFPEALSRFELRRRQAWFENYIATVLQRDVKDLSNIEGLTELPNVLSLLASRVGSQFNLSDVSRSLSIPHTTLKRYMALLQTVYLFVPLRPWATNLGLRLVKAPKVYLCDTGLVAHLAGVDASGLQANLSLFGHILENFVALELTKQIGWSRVKPALYHFRTLSNAEIDFILEARDGRVVAIEVKASSTVGPDSFKSMRNLQEHLGSKFHRGIVLYTGSATVPFGENMYALPISALWEIAEKHPPVTCGPVILGIDLEEFREIVQTENLAGLSEEATNYPSDILRKLKLVSVQMIPELTIPSPEFHFVNDGGTHRLYEISGFLTVETSKAIAFFDTEYGAHTKEGNGYKWILNGSKIRLLTGGADGNLLSITHDDLSNLSGFLMSDYQDRRRV